MIRIQDFQLPDGTWDIRGYYQARLDAGEICKQCRAHISEPTGAPATCHECEALAKEFAKPVPHWTLLRCPACSHAWDPDRRKLVGRLLRNGCSLWGDHVNVKCPQCKHTFAVEVRAEVSFISPACFVDSPVLEALEV